MQAVACYTPKFLWDAFEGGLLRMIVMGLNLGICREEEKQAKKEVIIGYLTSHLKVNTDTIHVRQFFVDFIMRDNDHNVQSQKLKSSNILLWNKPKKKI